MLKLLQQTGHSAVVHKIWALRVIVIDAPRIRHANGATYACHQTFKDHQPPVRVSCPNRGEGQRKAPVGVTPDQREAP